MIANDLSASFGGGVASTFAQEHLVNAVCPRASAFRCVRGAALPIARAIVAASRQRRRAAAPACDVLVVLARLADLHLLTERAGGPRLETGRRASQLLLSPTTSGWLASSPRAATVAERWASFGLRATEQGHCGHVATAGPARRFGSLSVRPHASAILKRVTEGDRECAHGGTDDTARRCGLTSDVHWLVILLVILED
jgi:hypothetical protein